MWCPPWTAGGERRGRNGGGKGRGGWGGGEKDSMDTKTSTQHVLKRGVSGEER